MATLRDIKRRIESVRSTQQITRAMKMVAAARLRKAQAAILAARPYAKRLHDILGHVARRVNRELHPLLADREPKRVCFVVVSADRGLCGGFNANIIRMARDQAARLPAEDVSLIIVGRKAYEHFSRHDFNIIGHYRDVFQNLDFSCAVTIASDIIKKFCEHKLDCVNLVYNEFKSPVQQRIVLERLLPIETESVAQEKYPVDFIYEPTPEFILTELCPKNINMQIWRVLLESSAAEQAARMTAMEAATENAQEMIRELTLYYNKVRQATITRELIEVISGAEALKRQARG